MPRPAGAEPEEAISGWRRDRRGLLELARELRRRCLGDRLEISAHIHMITPCRVRPPCRYCSLSSSLDAIRRRRAVLSYAELQDSMALALRSGVDSVVLVGGSDLSGLDAQLLRAVKVALAVAPGIPLDVDTGPSISVEGLRALRSLGVRAVFSAVETTSPRDFEEAKPGDSLSERIRLLRDAHELGLRTGTVIMNGLGDPIRTLVDLRREAPWLDYIYVSTFSPVPGTPWEGREPASASGSVYLVALARLMFPCAHVALADVLPEAGNTSGYLIHELAAGAGNTFSGLLVYKDTSLNYVDELRRAWQRQILK